MDRNKLNKDEIAARVKQMENDIIQERLQRKKGGGSLFSYHLYTLRVEQYRNREEGNSIDNLAKRLEDIRKQHLINIEDKPLDEELRMRSQEAIEEACKLLERL